MAGAVAGALSLALSQTAFASDQNLGVPTIGTPVAIGDDLSLATVSDVKHPENSVDALVYGSVITENIAESLNVNAQFGQADLEAVLRTEGFGDFGVAGEDGKGFDVSWLTGAVVLNNTADTLTVNNASVSATAAGVSDNPYLEVAGMAQYNGAVQFTGESTTISASSDLQMRADPDEESVVYGYIIENPIGQADQKRSATFSADKTSISASSTGSNGVDVIGVHFSADAADVPAITFAGKEATVTATNESRNQWAYGVFMHNSDGDREGTNATVTVNEGTSLTITAKGGEAVGLYADDGKFVSNGTLTISAEGLGDKVTAGIYALGNANLTFNGKTDVTATGSDAYALVVKYAEKIPEGMQTADDADAFPRRDHFGVTFAGETTLNGAVLVDKDMTVRMDGTMTVNGGLELSGTIDGTGSLTIDAKQATGTIAEGATISQESLTFANGSFENNGEINVTGDVTLNNVTFTNTVKNDVEVGGRVTLGNGTTLINHGGFHSNDWVLSSGSVYQEEASELGADGIMQMDSGRFELAGGIFGIIDNAATVNGWLVAPDAENAGVAPELVFSAGNYDYTSITVNTAVVEGKSALSVTGGTIALGTLAIEQGLATISGGELSVDTITIGDGATLALEDGKLMSSSGQFFTNALGADGSGTDAGALKAGLTITGGTLSVNDAKYNLTYAKSATNLVQNGTVSFTGELVDDDGSVLEEIGYDQVEEGAIHETVDVEVSGSETEGSVTLDKNFGAESLVVNNATNVTVSNDKTVTLVGNADNGELVNFDQTEGDKTIAVSGELSLGKADGSTSGQITTAQVKLEGAEGEGTGAKLSVQNGKFTVADVAAADKSEIAVHAGDLTVTKLTVDNAATVTVLGSVTAESIVHEAEGNTATVRVGTSETAGKLTVGSESIEGLTFFLDPTWVDGKEVTDASHLVFQNTTIDGNIVVGQNSYAVLGTNDDAAFLELFENGTLTWGNTGTLAAVYVGSPITVTGTLVVDSDLTDVPSNKPAGTVSFASNAVLVADMTKADAETPLISATTFEVATDSKAVIIGALKEGVVYKLTNAEEQNFWNTEETVLTGNAMWDLTVNEDGTFGAELQAASIVYPNMQGTALADAGMEAGDAWVDELLTDASGTMSRDDLSARFDAAMNPAGALTTFTTAFDRSIELRDAVRLGDKTAMNDKGLWVQITGGKTKLKGISSGGVDLHTKTTAYGVVVGGEHDFDGTTYGLAFSAGTGDTKNHDVDAKDDFDYYGLSFYGRTTACGFDVLGDVSAVWLKSDLTVGGLADVDTDTTTTVWSAGVQIRKAWDLGFATLTPFVGADLYHIRGDGYRNGHGAKVDDADATAVEFPIGAEIAKSFETNGMKVAPSFTLAVVPTVGDKDYDQAVDFAGASSDYNFTFADDVKVRSRLGIDVQKDVFRFGLSAGYDWGNEERSAANVQVRASYAF